MRAMRNGLLALAGIAVWLWVPKLMADTIVTPPTVVLTVTSGASDGHGGQFTATVGNTSALTAAGYDFTKTASATATTLSFQTFCLEYGEFFWPGAQMQAVMSTTNVTSGGVYSTPGSHAIKGNSAYGTNLTPQAAWLYYKFATGQLAGYNYGTVASAVELQKAFWHYQWDSAYAPWSSGNQFVALANGQSLAANQISFTEVAGQVVKTFTVRALNMWSLAAPLVEDPVTTLIAPGTKLIDPNTGNPIPSANNPLDYGTPFSPADWNDGPGSPNYSLSDSRSWIRQDQLYMEYAERSLPVPVPAAAWMGISLLGLIIGTRLWSRRGSEA